MCSTADDLKRHEPQRTELAPPPANATLYVAQSGLLIQKQMLQERGEEEKFLYFSTFSLYMITSVLIWDIVQP